jgi:hypothetical protein
MDSPAEREGTLPLFLFYPCVLCAQHGHIFYFFPVALTSPHLRSIFRLDEQYCVCTLYIYMQREFDCKEITTPYRRQRPKRRLFVRCGGSLNYHYMPLWVYQLREVGGGGVDMVMLVWE